MNKRLITAGLCALSVAGIAAAPASADTDVAAGRNVATIQFYNAQGLFKTVDCTTPAAPAECTSDAARDALINAPHGAPTDVIGAWRGLDANGKVKVDVYNNDASLAFVSQLLRGGGASAAPAARKVGKAASKKAAKHRKAKKARKA